jgi:hypothetical protein
VQAAKPYGDVALAERLLKLREVLKALF